MYRKRRTGGLVMMKYGYVFVTGLLLCTTVLPCLARQFSTGNPQVILAHEGKEELGIRILETGLFAVNDEGTLKWFSTQQNFPPSGDGLIYSVGRRENPFEYVRSLSGQIMDMPERGEDKLHPGNSAWIVNVCRDPEQGHILAFVRVEYWPFGEAKRKYHRLGLALSKDGGASFRWCGFIITPELTYETWMNHWKRTQPGSCDMGHACYIQKGGYFYVYYQDTRDLPDTAGHGLAVARARIRDVMAAANKYEVTVWKKYHQKKWSENGIGGAFSPLNIAPRGEMHGDAATCDYLHQYILVSRDDTGDEAGGVVISFSKNGIQWSAWQDVHRDNHYHDFPTIISLGSDNETVDKTFWIYYQYDEDDVMPEKYGKIGWNRIQITLE